MKKTNKLSTISIACVACAAVSLPALGAAPVRSLGGAGVYSSAASAKTSGSAVKTATNANRGGTVRVNTASTAAPSLRSATARAAATPRLSIGKYLAGASALNKVTSVAPGQPGQDSSDNTAVMERIDELSANVSDNKTELNNINLIVSELGQDLEDLLGKEISVSYEGGVLIIDGKHVPLFDENEILNEEKVNELLNEILDEHLKKLEDAVAQLDGLGNTGDINIWDDGDAESDKTITAAINKLNTKIVKSTNSYEAGENVKIEDNKVSVIVGALTGAEQKDGLATVQEVKAYALPIPDNKCFAADGNTTCVLSVNRDSGEYEWLELVETYSAPSNGTTDNSVTVVSEPEI